jgi:hypothetical protein
MRECSQSPPAGGVRQRNPARFADRAVGRQPEDGAAPPNGDCPAALIPTVPRARPTHSARSVIPRESDESRNLARSGQAPAPRGPARFGRGRDRPQSSRWLEPRANGALCPSKYPPLFARKYRPKYRSLRSELRRQLRRSLHLNLNSSLCLDLNPALFSPLFQSFFETLFQQLSASSLDSLFVWKYRQL